MPRVGFSPGYRLALPPPLGGGGGGRRPGGVGATRRDLSTSSAACGEGASPLPGPHPHEIATTVHCPGRAGGYSAFPTHAEVGGDDHQNRYRGSTGLAPRQ
jgi:hypothetical protein